MYQFTDPDGDDTEDGTLFQWYLCADPADEGTAITGATGKTYVPVSTDSGNVLRVEVTPVDADGNVGATIKSAASQVVELPVSP